MAARLATLSGNGNTLRQGLVSLTRALWLSELVVWLTRGLATGLAGSVLALVLARLVTVPVWAPVATIVVGLFAGAAVAATRPRSLHRTALLADHRLGLRERLTTAWELHQRSHEAPLAAAQLADATARLRAVKPFRTFPLRLPRRESAAAGGFLILAVALVLLPNPHRLDVQREQAQRKLIGEQAQAVGQLAQQIQTGAGAQPSAQQAATVQALQQLEQQLNDKSTTTANALSDLAAAEDRLRSQSNGNATAAKSGLDHAAAALAASQGGGSLTQALAQAIGQGQYAQAANQLQQLAGQAAGLTQQQRDALQATLHAAGAAAAKSDPALGQALQQAANSLGSASQPADPAAQQQAFNQAAAALQQAGQAVTSDGQTQQALSQVQASEATLSAAQQAASGQNGQTDAQNGAQGNQAQQVSSLNSATLGTPATGNPTDTANTGQPANSASAAGQPGQPGNAQTQQAGSGAAASQGQQNGQGQSGQGQSGQGQSGQGQGQGQGSGHGSSGGRNDQVYAPQSVNGHQVQLPNSAKGPGQQVAANGAENPENNQSLVPYNQVIGTYQQQAAQAMDQSHVPLDKKSLVRDYFSALAAGN